MKLRKMNILILMLLSAFIVGCANKTEKVNSVEISEVTSEALFKAVESKSTDKVKVLIEKGVDVDSVDAEGNTALINAINLLDFETAKVLATATKDVDKKNNNGYTALYYAVLTNHTKKVSTTEVVEALVEKGADVNILRKDGTSLLMLAVLCENFETVKLLVDKGADINYHTEKGEDALYYATSDVIRGYLINHQTNEHLVNTGGVVSIPDTPTVHTTQVQQEVNKPELELIDHGSENGYIIGKIKNNTGKTYSYVQVEINLYDGNGNQVDSTISNVLNLEPYKTWSFSAVVLDQSKVKKYQVVNIEGY